MRRWCGAIILVLVFLAQATPNVRATARVAERCFPETGYCVSGEFLDYWNANGGLAQQGLPITAAFDEVSPTDGKTYRVQYFERARFELHPENAPPYRVLLGLLGIEQLKAKYGGAVPPAGGSFGPTASCAAFADTGFSVCGPFLEYWRANGGLAQQGFPISPLFTETNPTDNKPYLTQYFERARFEWHPENQDPYKVLLGLLGREQYGAPPPPPAGHQPNAEESRLAVLLRDHPQQRRAAFRYKPILARVARERAADMAARGYFGHVNPDGIGPNALVRQAGYVLSGYYGTEPNANNIESIGAGAPTADELLQMLLGSAGHRTHLLGEDPFYAQQLDYGIGYVAAPNSQYGHYWVVIMAQPGP